MEVSEATKQAYKNGSSQKEISISFPELNYIVDKKLVDFESMKLDESILKTDSIEFVGCISSQFQVTVHDVAIDLKGKKIVGTIKAGDTSEIPLFQGVVDSVQKTADRNHKIIKAYDILYTKGQTDIADWYNGLHFPVTLKAFRDSLFQYLGITQVEKALPNDSLSFKKEYRPEVMQAIKVIKAICQINGAFGIINREGNFEYRILPGITEDSAEYTPEEIPYYRDCTYEDFSVKPVDKLTIRQSDSEKGVSYGSGENNYIIQGNMFTIGKTGAELLQIAKNLYPSIQGISYTPFNATNNGLPWVECGKDIVKYRILDFEASVQQGTRVYVDKQFYVFTRTLSGIQALKDNYRAEGQEYQREFLTDMSLQLETLSQKIDRLSRSGAYALNIVQNEEAVTIGDGESKSVIFTRFEAIQETICLTTTEVMLNVATDSEAVVTATYYLDDVQQGDRVPVDTFTTGQHLLHLQYALIGVEEGGHSFDIHLNSVGGSLAVDVLGGHEAIMGTGLDFSVYVKEIEVTELPDKTRYAPGDALDLTGLVITAYYNNGATGDITAECEYQPAEGDTLSEYDTLISVNYTEPVTANQFSTDFSISFALIQSIRVASPPDKVRYIEGEPLDYTGLVVMAVYQNGTEEDITQFCTLVPVEGTASEFGMTEVEVRFSD